MLCARPIISATSVFGRGAIQRAPCGSSMSPRTGLTLTKSTPASRAACCAPRATCRARPPELICVFLSASPPNATISSVCSAISSQCGADE